MHNAQLPDSTSDHPDHDDGPYDGWREEDAECPNCLGDGRDPWNDYLLPCPLCQGDQRPRPRQKKSNSRWLKRCHELRRFQKDSKRRFATWRYMECTLPLPATFARDAQGSYKSAARMFVTSGKRRQGKRATDGFAESNRCRSTSQCLIDRRNLMRYPGNQRNPATSPASAAGRRRGCKRHEQHCPIRARAAFQCDRGFTRAHSPRSRPHS